jgi:hypothetical protein
MFYIDGQQKLREITDLSTDELESSQVTVNSPASSTPTTTASGKSRRRKK